MKPPHDLATRWELLLDDSLLADTRSAALRLHCPERREVALTFDAPWEDGTAGYCSILRWEGVWRMYYRAGILDLAQEDQTATFAVAESEDGITFTRPDLGLVEFQGSPANNLLQLGGFPNVPPPFLDTNPACLPEERFKGLTSQWAKLWAMTSPDGLHWRPLQDGPLDLPGQFDTQNTSFWDAEAGLYRCYTRSWYDPVAHRSVREGEWNEENRARAVREIQHATSEDFLHWSAPEPLIYADDDYLAQMYTNSILPCPGAEHFYLGFPNRFVSERRVAASEYPGVNDALFMSSRDGVHWTRWLDAWVRPGLDERNWTHRNNYPAWGMVETSPTEWSMYISEHYEQTDGAPGRLRRLALRPHGFVSLRAGHGGGEALTVPLLCSGPRLHVNYSTSAAGSIQVELTDLSGAPLPGFSHADMPPLYGDSLDEAVCWKGASDLSTLRGQPLRLRLFLQDADLFAFRFGD